MPGSDPRRPARDPVTGQFAYEGDWGRICVCGHSLGAHIAGGFDCIAAESGEAPPGTTCDCTKFRPARRVRRAKSEPSMS